MEGKFSFEDLLVWSKSVDFCNQVINLTESINTDRKHFRLIEQLEAASASISSNIAEGNGRFSKKEFIQFLYIARGSLYETVNLLIVFYHRNWIKEDALQTLKLSGIEIGKMISGLIASVKRQL